jgi:predicted amidophosphoribosyltransferase
MPPRALAELVAVVVPPACAACRAPLPRATLRLCAGCARALPWLPRRLCPRCGLPSHRRGCPAAGAAFTRAWAPLAYEGVARELVAALKFRGALPLATLMAAHMAVNLPADLRAPPGDAAHVAPNLAADLRAKSERGGGTAARRLPRPGDGGGSPADRELPAPGIAIVAVPPQPVRARRRGFDPAAALAAALAPRLGLPEHRCLRRRDHGVRQVGATRAQRRRAGRLAIELRAPPPQRALLVDDVHTTGATLDACARALVAGGCREVVAVTYARTL